MIGQGQLCGPDISDKPVSAVRRNADIKRSGRPKGRLLFTAAAMLAGHPGSLMLFYAALAPSLAAFQRLLVKRLGPTGAHAARVVEGVDVDDPLVLAMISPETVRFLEVVSANPKSPLCDGLEVHHIQKVGV